MQWSKKEDREAFEINGFINAYAHLPASPQVSVISKGEKPDYVVKDVNTSAEFGVELTSVYADDRSVPDVHMQHQPGIVDIPYNEEQLEKYKKRLVATVVDKICKARHGYDTKRPLILAVYVNEYVGIYLGKPELEALVRQYEAVFDAMTPFAEVVFWNLGNSSVFGVRPS
jgi:hypothetical protein